jgi:hypothetical protein
MTEVIGRVIGPCRESIEPALGFAVASNDSRFERLLLPRHGALPSLSPFVLYRLRVNLGAAAPIWDVVEVLEASPLPVRKSELLKHVSSLIHQDGAEVAESLGRDLESAPDVLRPSDLSQRHSLARDVVADAWERDDFYELLPYFPAAFLRRLDDAELAFARDLFRAQPMLFAHWRVASRELSAGVSEAKLRADFRLLCFRESCSYDALCPALHAAHVAALRPDHAEAFAISLNALRDSYYRGNVVYPCGRALHAEQLAPYYLRVGEWLIDAEDARDQAELALRLKSLDRLELVQCAYFDDPARESLIDLAPTCYIRAARPVMEGWVDMLIAGNGTAEGLSGKNLCLVDAHKLSPRLLLEALNSHPAARRLFLVGDVNEEPAHYAAGGGDLFRDLYEMQPPASRRNWNVEHSDAYPARVARSLANRRSAHFETHRAEDEIELKKIVTGWRASRKGTYVIICSEDWRRQRVREWLDFHRPRLGHRVHLLETDEVGVLVHAISTSSRKRVPKKGVLHDADDYEMDVGARGFATKVKRSEATVEMADVALSRLWVGPRVDDLLFVADQNSSVEEIAGTLKYVKREFTLAMIGVQRLMDLRIPRRRRLSFMIDLMKRTA